jgi:hypothetical protein
LLGVVDALAPCVTEGVAEGDTVPVAVIVELAVALDVREGDAVGVMVPVTLGVRGALNVDDDVAVGVQLPEKDMDGVPLALPPVVKVVVGVALTLFETLSVVDPLSLPEEVGVGEFELVAVPEMLPLAVPVDEPVGEGVRLEDSEIEGVILADPPTDCVVVGVAEIVDD